MNDFYVALFKDIANVTVLQRLMITMLQLLVECYLVIEADHNKGFDHEKLRLAFEDAVLNPVLYGANAFTNIFEEVSIL
jgi:hypothetical protein